MSHSYAVTNKCAALAAAAFTPTSGPSDDTRLYLGDGKMGLQYVFTAAASTNKLVIDFGSAVNLAGIAILNSNIASATSPTVLVENASDAAITTDTQTPKATTTLNTTAPSHKDHVLQMAWSDPENGATARRYWRITWAWTGTFTLKVGEIFAYGPSTTVLTRINVDGSGGREDYIVASNQMQYGETRANFRAGPIRQKAMRFADLTSANLTELRTMWSAVGGPTTPLLWAESHENASTAAAAAQQECIYGLLAEASFGWHSENALYQHDGGFVLRSLGREVGS